MRTFDVDILIVPGWTNSGPDHWQSRWERRLKTARRVVMPDFDRPVRNEWVSAIADAADIATRPVVLVAHSCGVAAVAHAAAKLSADRVIGAMLVAPVDLEVRGPLEELMRTSGPGLAFPDGFLPLPTDPFPFPSLVIASRDDAFCSYEAAGDMALAWGSTLVDAGNVGHINTASGHGPWPDGALRLGMFLRQLGDARQS